MGAQRRFTGVRPVEQHVLAAGAGRDPVVVADRDDGDDRDHQSEVQGAGAGAETAEQAEGQGGEVVGDLVLGQLLRAQPDDRQDAEEAQPQAGTDGAGGQGRGDSQDPDVGGEVGDDELGPTVAGQEEAEDQDADGDEVGQVGDVGRHEEWLPGGWQVNTHHPAGSSCAGPQHML